MDYLTTLKIRSSIDTDEALKSITSHIHIAIRGSGVPIPQVQGYSINDDGLRVFDDYSVNILFTDIKTGLVSLRKLLSELGYLNICDLQFANHDYNLFDLSSELL